MSWKRDKAADRAMTNRMLAEPAARPAFGSKKRNWLGHSGGSAAIDLELLVGASMARLLVHRKTINAVNNHLDHLEEEHELAVERTNLYRLGSGLIAVTRCSGG